MIVEEIQKEIDKKGTVVRDVYKALLDRLLEDGEVEKASAVDIASIVCYDITVLFMDKILGNQSHYKEILGLSQRNISRIEKDLETMSLFIHPQEYEALEMYEQSIVDGL